MNNFKIPYYIYAIFFGVLLGWIVMAIIGNMFISPKPAPTPKSKVVEKRNVPVDSMAKDIIEKNIFLLDIAGEKEVAVNKETVVDNTTIAGAEGKKIEPAPPFNAELLGIVFDEEKMDGIATIKLDSGTISLGLGKTKDNITLVDIAPAFATISKDKKRYSLVLDRELVDKYKQKESEKRKESSNEQVAVAGSGVTINDKGANINIMVPRNELKSDLKDLNKLLESALISPFYKEDKFQGYRVAKIKEHSPLKKLGLQINDVITRINGSEISNPAVLFQMLSKIDDISAITVDMIRNDEKKSVFVEIR